MKTLELIILNLLENNGYALNEDMTDIEDVVNYLEMCNEDVTPDNVYTPEDWFRDTRNNYPEYLVKKGE